MDVSDQHRLLGPDGKAVRFRRSPNCSGQLRARFLIMHYTAGRSADSAVAWLCNPTSRASAHLVIGRDGSITQLVPFNVRAWHAGTSEWEAGGQRFVRMNQYAIGIELDYPGPLVRTATGWRSESLRVDFPSEAGIAAVHKQNPRLTGWGVYPSLQLTAASRVAAALVAKYELQDVIGHEDVSPGRKFDPGPAFPMDRFRRDLFAAPPATEPPQPEPASPGATNAAQELLRTSAAVRLRLGPGTEHAQRIPRALPPGTRVQAGRKLGAWREVRVLDAVYGQIDLAGWVHSRYLTG